MTREQYEIRKIEERRRAFMLAVEPFVRFRVHVASICMPKFTVYPDGRVDTEYPEWAKEHFAKCDEVIADIARTFDILRDGSHSGDHGGMT
jgi:hypothetical protein